VTWVNATAIRFRVILVCERCYRNTPAAFWYLYIPYAVI